MVIQIQREGYTETERVGGFTLKILRYLTDCRDHATASQNRASLAGGTGRRKQPFDKDLFSNVSVRVSAKERLSSLQIVE